MKSEKAVVGQQKSPALKMLALKSSPSVTRALFEPSYLLPCALV